MGRVRTPREAAPARAEHAPKPADLARRIGTAAFAFRGYDVANLGRSPELLDHPAYGPVVAEVLDEASEVCSEAVGPGSTSPPGSGPARRRRWTASRRTSRRSSRWSCAQVRLLEEFFEVPVRQARLSFGYSIGELSALIVGGVYALEQILPIPLAGAATAPSWPPTPRWASSSPEGPVLPTQDVERLCSAISSQGHGLIGPSAYLSPNTVLLLGQGDTLDRLEAAMGEFLPEQGHRSGATRTTGRRCTRRWSGSGTSRTGRRWPSTTSTGGCGSRRRRCSRASPARPATTSSNSRDLLIRWTDHPQRLWDVIYETLAAGIDLVVHVGPEPNLIPATFERLSNNVLKQMGSRAPPAGLGVDRASNRTPG